MTDYVAIALQGFSTGIGVIIAHECWDYFKKYREGMKKQLNDFKKALYEDNELL